MPKNYRFEILAFLFKSPGYAANLLPFIENMTNEHVFSRLYFTIVMQSMRDKNFVSYEDDGDEINARLLPAGEAEYYRMKEYRTIIH